MSKETHITQKRPIVCQKTPISLKRGTQKRPISMKKDFCYVRETHNAHVMCCTCVCALQHTATHCNTLQCTATHCNALQHTAIHCNALQCTAMRAHTYMRHITHTLCTPDTSRIHVKLQHTLQHTTTLLSTWDTHYNTVWYRHGTHHTV